MIELRKWVNNMGIYSPYEVYPQQFDEMDLSSCENCSFDCDIHGYCVNERD